MRKSATILFLLWAYSLIAAVLGYVNPILPYDYSDPDIICVGDTYLMTSSPFARTLEANPSTMRVGSMSTGSK